MHRRAVFTRGGGDLRNRLQYAGFVLRVDHRHKADTVADDATCLINIDAAVVTDLDAMNGVAFSCQQIARLVRRRMLDRAGDDGALAAVRFDAAANGDVVRFGPAAGEDNLIGFRADQRGDMAARDRHRILCCMAKRIARRRVTVLLAQERQHGVEHAGGDRRRRVVVEIDRHRCVRK